MDALVKRHPDWTERRYAVALSSQHGIEASSVTVGRVIRRLGYSVKKRPCSQRSEIGQTSVGDDASISGESPTSPLRVWFLWTKRAPMSG